MEAIGGEVLLSQNQTVESFCTQVDTIVFNLSTYHNIILQVCDLTWPKELLYTIPHYIKYASLYIWIPLALTLDDHLEEVNTMTMK